VDETAERLMEESTKAQENGKGYADLTARNAALAVERRHQLAVTMNIGPLVLTNIGPPPGV
jgi:hypothetical protein